MHSSASEQFYDIVISLCNLLVNDRVFGGWPNPITTLPPATNEPVDL